MQVKKKENKTIKKEEKVVVKEEKKAEKIEHKIDGRTIGKAGYVIESIKPRNVNGRPYNYITTTDGQTFLLSDKDVEDQVSS